jgi:hypothetical protein
MGEILFDYYTRNLKKPNKYNKKEEEKIKKFHERTKIPIKKWTSLKKSNKNEKYNKILRLNKLMNNINLTGVLDQFKTKKITKSTVEAIENCIIKRYDRMMRMIKDPNKKHTSAKIHKLFLKALSN